MGQSCGASMWTLQSSLPGHEWYKNIETHEEVLLNPTLIPRKCEIAIDRLLTPDVPRAPIDDLPRLGAERTCSYPIMFCAGASLLSSTDPDYVGFQP